MPTDFPTPQQMNAFEHFIGSIVTTLPRIGLLTLLVVVGLFILWKLTILLLCLLDLHRLFGRDMLFLELTPPAFADKTPHANQQFFTDLHGFETMQTIKNTVLMHKVAFSAEMVGTREGGIRFVFCVPRKKRETFESVVAAYDTNILVREIEDYLPKAQRLQTRWLEFGLLRPYYPLKSHTSYKLSDPVEYLLTAMANLQPNEMIVLQLVLSPTKVRSIKKLTSRLLYNKEHLDQLGKRHGQSFGGMVAGGISSTLLGITGTIGEIHHGTSNYGRQSRYSTTHHHQQVAAGIKPARSISSLETALAEEINHKLEQFQFRTNIRAMIVAASPEDKANDITKSFNVYRTNYQAIKKRLDFPYSLRSKYRRFMFEHRLPEVFSRYGSLLSIEEVASIYHFPSTEANYNGDVTRSLSKTLPISPIIKKRADKGEFDVILGTNIHHGATTNIGMLAKEREKHMYIIGSTGSGKSTFMEYAIVQDIHSGKGAAFIDPHGDSAKKILKYIPEERIKDVIYFNPIDIKHPIGLNFLELPTGLDEDELLLEKGRVTSAVVSVMRKVFSDDDASAHRIEAVMRNAVHTALTVEGATLFTVLKLFRNGKFRKEVVSKLEDEDLKDFWQEEIGQAGEMQMVSMTKGVTQRIDRFNISVPAKRMMGQSKSTISFEDIMDSGKILICNLGDLEEDETSLFGTTVLAKLKMAAERRARMPEHERKPFYVYVDEFQNFATTPFVKMLSSSRKYKLFLTIAEQSTKQQEDDRLTEAILSNVSTAVCFRTGSHDDEELMLHRFDPFLTKGDISNLPTYNFYIRIQAEESLEPMSGKTIVLPKEEASQDIADAVVKMSQETYAIEYANQLKAPAADSISKQPKDNKESKGAPKKGVTKKSSKPLENNDDS